MKKNWERKKKYPDAFRSLNQAYSSLSSLRRDSLDEKTIHNHIESFCTSLSEAFCIITGTKCSVAIKTLGKDVRESSFDQIPIRNFSRDKQSTMDRQDIPYLTTMTVEANSDFRSICERFRKKNYGELFYFENDLIGASQRGYKNSRLGPESYRLIEKYTTGRSRKILNDIWMLPYRSTIVVAIFPMGTKPPSDYDLRGFLCVDSPEAGSFTTTDLEILQGVADFLFDFLDFIQPCYGCLDVDKGDQGPLMATVAVT